MEFLEDSNWGYDLIDRLVTVRKIDTFEKS
jgi:hypothetical protein